MKRDNILSSLIGVFAGAALMSLMGAGQPNDPSQLPGPTMAGAPTGGFVVIVSQGGHASVINEQGAAKLVTRQTSKGNVIVPNYHGIGTATP